MSKSNKATILIGVTLDLTDKVSANDIMQKMIEQFGGKGGGSKTLARGVLSFDKDDVKH